MMTTYIMNVLYDWISFNLRKQLIIIYKISLIVLSYSAFRRGLDD